MAEITQICRTLWQDCRTLWQDCRTLWQKRFKKMMQDKQKND
jgi:hypothetical protein